MQSKLSNWSLSTRRKEAYPNTEECYEETSIGKSVSLEDNLA